MEEARRRMVHGDWSIYLEIVTVLQTLPSDCLVPEPDAAEGRRDERTGSETPTGFRSTPAPD